MTYEQFLHRIQHLKVDRSGGTPKPYKPLLLCAVVILIHKGEIATREVFLDGGLKSVFHQLLRRLFDDRFPAAQVNYPFRHLETDGVWRLVPRAGEAERLQLARAMGGAAWQVLKHVGCAQLAPEVFLALATDFEKRFQVLQTLIRTYGFPLDRTGHVWDLLGMDPVPAPGVREPAGILTEKAVEEHLETHWDRTEFARMGIALCRPDVHGFAGRQVMTPLNTIDLLGFRAPQREWWVFELKKGRSSDAVVGQVGRYMGWIGERARPGEQVRGAVIVGRADEKLKYSVRSNDRLSLWEYDARLAIRQVAVA